MTSPGRAEAGIWAAVLALASAGWLLTGWQMAGIGDSAMMPVAVLPALPIWTAMMAAMMLPSVGPFAVLYARSILSGGEAPRRRRHLAALLTGYLAAWTAFGVGAHGLALGLGSLSERLPGPDGLVFAVALACGGAYQFTRLKDRCLQHCRSPLGFLLRYAEYTGPLRDARAGLHHGAYCIGCCAGLMVVLVALGAMSLLWMLLLTALILAEKTWRHGGRLRIATGGYLVATGLLALVAPELVPEHYTAMGGH